VRAASRKPPHPALRATFSREEKGKRDRARRVAASICAMIDWSTCPEVERDAARLGGAWTFRGTRVPVSALFENLEEGARVQDFIAWFPGVSADQVRAVLEHAARSALAAA